MPHPRKPDPFKKCEICGLPLVRKRYNGRLEDRGVFLRRGRCNQACANSRAVVDDDSYRWRARRSRKDACETCGSTVRLHVHHVDGQPSNNSASNLRTLCASCHMRLHWADPVWRAKTTAAIRASRIRSQEVSA